MVETLTLYFLSTRCCGRPACGRPVAVGHGEHQSGLVLGDTAVAADWSARSLLVVALTAIAG